ncbi:mitochondrial fission process protein 1 [Pelagophyceae sp. CCMP2097]|nr:mitochondrial fission process protein 1 [Pelagophyceae sp. CCMP2097]
MPPEEVKAAAEVDVYRDTYVRFFGYTNELGESFKPLISRWVYLASYGVAGVYVILDAHDKRGKVQLSTGSDVEANVAGLDALVWQCFASVALPGFVINRVVSFAGFAVNKITELPLARRFAPTAVGLLSIPLIIQPIDHLVDRAMDDVYRPLVRSQLGKAPE